MTDQCVGAHHLHPFATVPMPSGTLVVWGQPLDLLMQLIDADWGLPLQLTVSVYHILLP